MGNSVGLDYMHAQIRKHPGYRGLPAGNSSRKADAQHSFTSPAPHLAGINGVDHKHGNSQWPHTAWHRSDGASHVRDIWIHVSNQGGTLLHKILFAGGIPAKKMLEFGPLCDLV